MEKNYYFKFSELIRTDQKLTNLPELLTHVENLLKLVRVLNLIRDIFDAPIIINSAFRTPEVNQAVNGSKKSYHLQGRAADIRPSYIPSNEYYKELSRLSAVIMQHKHLFKEVIIYDTFIHVAI